MVAQTLQILLISLAKYFTLDYDQQALQEVVAPSDRRPSLSQPDNCRVAIYNLPKCIVR
jgi:hypothetical protein